MEVCRALYRSGAGGASVARGADMWNIRAMLIRTRQLLRRTVPEPLRAQFARARRAVQDRANGTHHRLAVQRDRAASGADGWHPVVTLRQTIRRSAWWEGKLANLQLGAGKLDGVILAPGQMLSFWHLVGRPSAAAGFALGRGIRGDVPGGDIGGGLCQLSGITYELALRAGLSVAERHPHSRDIYRSEEDRFAALGLDATVVWPWKDLRVSNPHPAPIRLQFAVEGMELIAALSAAQPLQTQALRLEREDDAEQRRVAVWRGDVLISRDRYVVDRGA